MPHISKKKLKKKTFDRLFRKLLSTFEDAHKKHSFSSMMQELFTDTEKTMLTKRLMIILLLSKEIPQHRIVDILHVSPSTVAKMSLLVEIGKYDSIIKIASRKNLGFIDLIEFLLSGGGIMPPIAGRGRWKRIFKEF